MELFGSKFQSHMFKVLKAANDEEATEAGRAFEHNLEVMTGAAKLARRCMLLETRLHACMCGVPLQM